jgi:3-dehydroquinate synthase
MDQSRIPARRFIVSNATVWKLHGDAFAGVSADDPILLPDGERYKTLATVTRVYDALIKARADRSSAIVAVGGGVVGDTAGFAAATYMRGIPVVQVPTTLLAQVDSALGGKVGVNHPQGKNMIGAFHQAALVAIDPAVLDTLPRREFRAGMYEVVKYGVIASRPLFDRVSATLKALFARDHAALLPVIQESCAIKTDVVGEDEREHGRRRILNFGHTAGHALEAVTKYRRFRHGEAVAYGMLVAADIAVSRGTMPETDRQALAELIAKMGPLPAVGDVSIAEVLEAMGHDKKRVAGRMHYVLPTSIGTCDVVTDVTPEEIAAALTRCWGI